MKRLFSKRVILILLCVLFFLVAWNRDINLLYGMFALVASTLVLAHYLPGRSLKKIELKRTAQEAVFEDEEMEIHMSVRNMGSADRYMIEIIDSIPAAEPDRRTPMTFIAKLSGRKTRNYSFKLKCFKRGEYTLGPLTLCSSYPLGIAESKRQLEDEKTKLLVFPSIFEIGHFPLLTGSNFRMIGMESLSKAGGGEEYFGTREYREGDSIRYIHWPSTARHGDIIVKEFEMRASVEMTIVLDLHKDSDIGKEKESTLEYAVRIAASVSKYVLERGHSLQIIGYEKVPRIVSLSKGIAHLASVLEALAKVKADGNTPYAKTIRRSVEIMNEGSTALLIFNRIEDLTDEYYYALAFLRSKRILPVCVFLDDGSFLDKANTISSEPPIIREFISEGAPVYHIARGDDLGRVFSP